MKKRPVFGYRVDGTPLEVETKLVGFDKNNIYFSGDIKPPRITLRPTGIVVGDGKESESYEERKDSLYERAKSGVSAGRNLINMADTLIEAGKYAARVKRDIERARGKRKSN